LKDSLRFIPAPFNFHKDADMEHGYQPMLLTGESTAEFPSTRYQGSKARLVDWIWDQVQGLSFHTCLDAFGGTGAVAYRFKQAGKRVTYNDILRFNYYFGMALIENASVTLGPEDVDWILRPHSEVAYPDFIQRTFHDIYFTDEENAWLDRVVTNICALDDPYKRALAFFALAQAAIVKRPYNLFHRKNLYLRFAEVERSFGNKASWDRPFEAWFCEFVEESNQAVFDNGEHNSALNADALTLPNDYDLVYVDPPYLSRRGVGVDYRDFYHFLEGLTMYATWEQQIDWHSRHRRLQRQPNPWTDKNTIHQAFDELFRHYRDSILVISYRSDGIPTAEELRALSQRYKRHVHQDSFGAYKYVLSTNPHSEEILFIAE